MISLGIWMWMGCTEEAIEQDPFADVVRYQTSIATLESNVQSALADGLPSMLEVFTEYETIMSEWADETCPEFNAVTGGAGGHWVDDCTTADGVRFNGFVLYSGFENNVATDEFGGQFGNIWGSFEAIAPDGARRAIGGMGQLNVLPEGGSFDMFVDGAFWMNTTSEWMQTGTASFGVELAGIDKMKVRGGVQYPNVTLSFDEMIYHVDRCDGVLRGKLRLRDSTGYWFEVEREECSECQTVMWEGYPVGEMCIGEDLDLAMKSLMEQVTSVIE